MENYKLISKILKTDQDIIKNLDNLDPLKGRIIDGLAQELIFKTQNQLNFLGLNFNSQAKEIELSLEEKLKKDEDFLKEFFKGIDFSKEEDCQKILDFVASRFYNQQGFFLKTDKLVSFLKNIPPKNLISQLGYHDVNELLEKEDLFDIYACLRFAEDSSWLNNEFFKQYESLTKDDFEKREIISKPLNKRLSFLAKEFVEKKYHNLSHLKEVGLVFIIPINFNQDGQLMKIFSLAFHYFYEVLFYSDLFYQHFQDADFSSKLISLLRGDIPEVELSLKPNEWLIIQRYLEKDDPYEQRLNLPHINPEALHWSKAQKLIANLNSNFNFWKDTDWLGFYFEDEIGEDVLISFNLIDISMNLADKEKLLKHSYHQREALWNKIFTLYKGENLDELLKENILKGKIIF